MSLEDDLASQRASAWQRRTPLEREVRAAAVEHTARSGLAAGALKVGDVIPPVVLPDIGGVLLDVTALLNNGPVVINFYRGSWCPYCSLELRAFQRELDAIRELGASMVAISPELPSRTEAMAASDALEFPLLHDQDNRVARCFRLVHRIDPQVVGYQLRNGNDVAVYNGAEVAEVPLPAIYVIDQSGLICYAFVDADYTRRSEPDAVIEVLRELKACFRPDNPPSESRPIEDSTPSCPAPRDESARRGFR